LERLVRRICIWIHLLFPKSKSWLIWYWNQFNAKLATIYMLTQPSAKKKTNRNCQSIELNQDGEHPTYQGPQGADPPGSVPLTSRRASGPNLGWRRIS
jgi:hypothetical protein